MALPFDPIGKTKHAVTTPAAAYRVIRPGPKASSSDRIPAILWLSLVLLALWAIRHQALPTGRQAATGAAAVGAIVLAGSVAPRVVVWALLALVVASALGAAPQLTPFIDQIRTQGVTLSKGVLGG